MNASTDLRNKNLKFKTPYLFKENARFISGPKVPSFLASWDKFLVFLFFISTNLFGNTLTPVIFIPGYSASSPVKGQVKNFLFHRGFPPNKLEISLSYYTLIKTFEKAGYKSGKTLFKAAYDWRMSVAPQDGNFDGVLENVTAASITSGNYSYAINYLGYWLDQAVQANPGIDYVDIITHSTGGILARAYIQSPAYGAEYIDQHGNKKRLPKVRYLILGACPNFGSAHSWRAWNGDFQDVLTGFIPTTEIEGRFTALTFLNVLNGKTVEGPDYNITLESILKTDKFGNLIPDQTEFFRLYVPLRQSLMATYNFLFTPGSSNPINVNFDPSVRSDVLLDLNANSSPGNNPWLSLIGTPDGQGGAISTYATGARVKTSILDFIIPGLIDSNEFISSVIYVMQLSNQQGSFLPILELLKINPSLVPVTDSLFPRIGDTEISQQLNGDGNGAYTSLVGNFAGDPRMTLTQWGNGAPPANIPPEIIWNKITGYPVYHDVFFFNPDVSAYVVSILSGRPIKPWNINKMNFFKWYKKFGPILEGSDPLLDILLCDPIL